MYLESVLKTFDTKKSFGSDDLYKLNEAIFNLPEDDRVDAKTTSKLFVVMNQIEKSFGSGKYDKSDANFFYDYIGLLGTMQNQTFFSENQHKTLLGFMSRAAGDGKAIAPEPEAPAPRSSGKDTSRLESENQRLKEEIEKLKTLSSAVKLIQTWTMPVDVVEGDAPKKKSRKSRKRKGAKAEEGEAGDADVAAPAA